jgi:hypothetical protein
VALSKSLYTTARIRKHDIAQTEKGGIFMQRRITHGVLAIFALITLPAFAQTISEKEAPLEASDTAKKADNKQHTALEGLSYQTFFDYLASGKIKSVTLLDGPSMHDMKVTLTKDGQETIYSVDRPYVASEDLFLINYLKEHQVPYESIVQPYEDMEGFSSDMVFYLLGFGIPIIATIVMLILLSIVLVRTNRLEKMLQIVICEQKTRPRGNMNP